MKVKLTLSSFFVDKTETKEIKIDEDKDAVQMPDGNILKVKQLKGEALEQYIYEKYIENSPLYGRVLNIEYV